MFAELVRAYRLRLGMTQEELATASGIAPRTIRNIETGRVATPRLITLRLLADALRLQGTERDHFHQSALLPALLDDKLPARSPGKRPSRADADTRQLPGESAHHRLNVPVAGAARAADEPVASAKARATDSKPAASEPIVPRQLPADLVTFVGREEELDRLDTLAAEVPDLRNGLTIIAIDGMGGIGKTALAVRAAHRVAGRFPDGQLFIDLKGFTDERAPIEPIEALERMLAAVGVSGQQIPPALDERAGLWRSVLAGRRMLIVLDNAAAAAQVTPLLPGVPGCLVIVTSRRRLAGLSASVREVSLDMLPPADAVSLFARVAGSDRIANQPDLLVSEVVELCWRLPLAISIAATLLRSHPVWTMTELVDRLRDEHQRLPSLPRSSWTRRSA